MQPELQKIQKKYKDKKDQASVQKMQEETQLVYQKYGVSPTGSCVQLLSLIHIYLYEIYAVNQFRTCEGLQKPQRYAAK